VNGIFFWFFHFFFFFLIVLFSKIAIKPDGVQRGLVGTVVSRFEQKGYKLVNIKLVTPTPEFAAKHYADLSSKPFFPGLVEYFRLVHCFVLIQPLKTIKKKKLWTCYCHGLGGR
jgi:nucleoside diphosphate kinase